MHPDELPPADDQQDIDLLLASLDHQAPVVSADAIAAAARRRPRVASGRWRSPTRWAAAVLLSVAAVGAAVAAPGSPILGWVTALGARLGGQREHPVGPSGAQDVEPGGLPAGIALPPGDSLAIVFAAVPADCVARVSFGEGSEVLVRARPGAARFTSGPDRLVIEALSVADTFAIEIPRTAARVELRAGGVRLLLAARGQIISAMPPDHLGRYHLYLSPRAGD